MCHLKHTTNDVEHEAKVKAAIDTINRLVILRQKLLVLKNFKIFKMNNRKTLLRNELEAKKQNSLAAWNE